MSRHVHFAESAEEIDAIVELRYHILRAPWGQPLETARDTLEPESFNAYIRNEQGEVIACGRLQRNSEELGQIRYMAVREDQQGMNFGAAILDALEEKARQLGLKKIELQARENALGFYRSKNYLVKEKTFRLWDVIQHYLMEKEL